MAHSKQAKKRVRQNQKQNLHNRQAIGHLRSATKQLMEAVKAGDKKEVQRLLPLATKHIDKAAQTHVIHDNAAARKKSQIMRAVQGMK